MADGISMGFGDYVSSSTERDVAARERAVTKWDVDNHHLHQLKELLHEYQSDAWNVRQRCLHGITND